MAERRTTDRRKAKRELRVDVTRLEYERLEQLVARLTDRVIRLEGDLQALREKIRS